MTALLLALCLADFPSQITKEVVTNWVFVGSLRFNNGTNYEVLQPQIWTNVTLRASYEGREIETILKSSPGPQITNWCAFRFRPIDTWSPPWAGWVTNHVPLPPPPMPTIR